MPSMTQAPIWLVANWKMNGTAASVADYAFHLSAALANAPATIIGVFCPPTIYIADAELALPQNTRLHVGAQNCHAEKSGAFTGEISASMLKDAGCDHVILGHSERRKMGETDAEILAKAQAAIAAGLTPILCVGESQAEYEAKQTNAALDKQLAALAKLKAGSYLVAYEPVWAIGSGKTPSMAEIGAVHRHIKTVLGSAVSVLYGGSVNSGNGRAILGIPEVSGALIGSASLDISTMHEIINAARG